MDLVKLVRLVKDHAPWLVEVIRRVPWLRTVVSRVVINGYCSATSGRAAEGNGDGATQRWCDGETTERITQPVSS